jgi:hypothetical protein
MWNAGVSAGNFIRAGFREPLILSRDLPTN